jgi:flavin-dependent dehydrogenase
VIADVAVVGGGPSGAITAAGLARSGHGVVLLERSPVWRWRACGVFTSPAAVAALHRVGVANDVIQRVARPIPAMRVETGRQTTFRLTYAGAGTDGASAVGLDRGELDRTLLEDARAAGADVRTGCLVEGIELASRGDRRTTRLRVAGDAEVVEARIVIGADGLRSVVARAAGVDRRSPLGRRVALTFHLPDPLAGRPHDARMIVIDDGYVGLAPVPGGRVNVGIVLGRSWFQRLRGVGAAPVARRIVEELPAGGEPAMPWDVLDAVAGASPLGHRVSRRAGDGWLLVGDAAGFLDPFTGEGIHRAVVSAELAIAAVTEALAENDARALLAYDRAMQAAFGMKDRASRLVQAFLGHPPLFEYAARRLASRPGVRETMGLVIGDLVPAARALEARYLAALLRP